MTTRDDINRKWSGDKPPASPSLTADEKAIITVAAVALLVVIGGVCLGIWLFSSHVTHATVTSAHWSVTRNLHTRATMHGNDWGAPSGAFNVACESRFYENVSCNSYSCNYHREKYDCRCRNRQCDTCSRTVHDTCWQSCPIYRDWCSYDYYAWPVTNTVTLAGEGVLVRDPEMVAGENQTVEQVEAFKVNFAHKGKVWDLSPSRAEFVRYVPGSEWVVTVTHAGGFTVVGRKGER